jgi:CHAD domain-containing protein
MPPPADTESATVKDPVASLDQTTREARRAATETSPGPGDSSGAMDSTFVNTSAANDLAPTSLCTPDAATEWPMTPASPMLQFAYWHFGREFAVLRREAPRAYAGDTPEGVHEMRIATRRLRAALRAFKALLPVRTARSWVRELRWLAASLGRVRDLDVYCDHIERYIDGLPSEARVHLRPYLEQLAVEHAAARQALVDALDSARYARFMDRVGQRLAREPTPAATRRWQNFRVADGAPAYVDARLKRLRRRGRRLHRESPPEELHALRIRCKRLRYLLELFAPLYGDALATPINALRRVQDTLGRFQDATIATRRLEAYAASLTPRRRSAELLLALGRLAQIQSAFALDARRRARKAWRRFDSRVSRRRLRELLATVD